MDRMQHTSFKANDRSYFSLIKKDVHHAITQHEFPVQKVNAVDIIVSEMTSNLQKHADGGEILLGIGSNDYGDYVEIMCLDDGPGIADMQKVLADGYSSSNTLGHGLGSIQRLSDESDFYSLKGWGTIVISRLYKVSPAGYRKKYFEFGGLNVAKPGEQVSGDGFCLLTEEKGFRLWMADGLGHGPGAHEVVDIGCRAFHESREVNTVETIRHLHHAVRRTRGAVGLTVFYNADTKQWAVTGIGNISAKWIGSQHVKSFSSYNGIIGLNIPGSLNELCMSQEEYPLFICCSDGIKTRWDISKFPQVLRHSPAMIAAAIYKEFGRKTDDMSVIVCKTF